MNYRFSIFLVFSLLFSDLYSQNFFNKDVVVFDRETKLEEAYTSFNVEKYGEAFELFQEVYHKETDQDIRMELFFLQTECLRLTNTYKNLERAGKNYSKLHEKYKYTSQKNGYIVLYNWGLVKQMLGQYDEAKKLFQDFKALVPDHPLVEDKIKSCNWAMENKDELTRYELSSFVDINTSYFEFSPAYSGNDYNTLYYTTNRPNDLFKNSDAGLTIGGGSAYSGTYDIWSITKNNKGWSNPQFFIDDNGKSINTTDHEANPSTTIDGKTIYFTKCSMPGQYDPGDQKKPYCRIFFTSKKEKGWTAPVMLSLPYDSIANFGHPAVSKDGKKIFFASDMPGGIGGNDIWFIQKVARDKWGYPINLGPNINTAGDEIYPFLHEDGQKLYFASNGRIGFGGYDIFKSEWDKDGNLISVHNMKSPVNSSMNDYSLILEKNFAKGFLATDRESRKNGDIYYLKLTPLILTVSGVVTEEGANTIVSNAMVKIMGTNGSEDSILTDNSGRYKFDKDYLSPGNSYSVSVNKKDYESANSEFSTIGVTDSDDIIIDLVMVNVKKDINDLNEPNSNIAFFEYNSYELREDAMQELDRWAEYILNYEGLVFQINAYADFRGKDNYNVELSMNRALACKKYLVDNKGVDKDRILITAKGEKDPYVMDYNDGKFKKGDILSQDYINKLKRKNLIEKAHQYNRRAKIIWLEDKRFDKLRGGIIDY